MNLVMCNKSSSSFPFQVKVVTEDTGEEETKYITHDYFIITFINLNAIYRYNANSQNYQLIVEVMMSCIAWYLPFNCRAERITDLCRIFYNTDSRLKSFRFSLRLSFAQKI